MQDQWKRLIFQPLSDLTPESRSVPFVFVIDALDECEHEKDVKLILGLLTQAKDLSNVRLRVLITSRPESHIRSGFSDASLYEHLDLHKVPSSTIEHDIRAFFEYKTITVLTKISYKILMRLDLVGLGDLDGWSWVEFWVGFWVGQASIPRILQYPALTSYNISCFQCTALAWIPQHTLINLFHILRYVLSL